MPLRIALLTAVLLWPALPQTPSHPLQAALELFNSGKYKECFDIVSPYVQQNPESPTAHKLLGMDQYMLGYPPREALKEVLRATELAPRDADAFYYLGRLYFSADNAPGALGAFQKAVELDPLSVKAHTQMGQTYEVLGRMADAEKAYLQAIELDRKQVKKSGWPYYSIGLLCWNNGRKEESVAYFREAIARNPGLSEAKIKLAVALSNQKPEEARRLLEEVVRADAGNAEGHYRLALLLSKSGKQQEAAEQFALFEKCRKP